MSQTEQLNELAGELRDINQGREEEPCRHSGRGDAAGNGQDINLMGAIMGYKFIPAAKERPTYCLPQGDSADMGPCGDNPRGWTHTG